jgi:hypothetical protein
MLTNCLRRWRIQKADCHQSRLGCRELAARQLLCPGQVVHRENGSRDSDGISTGRRANVMESTRTCSRLRGEATRRNQILRTSGSICTATTCIPAGARQCFASTTRPTNAGLTRGAAVSERSMP